MASVTKERVIGEGKVVGNCSGAGKEDGRWEKGKMIVGEVGEDKI